jgi:DNA-binding Xre family transcriptional regulator
LSGCSIPSGKGKEMANTPKALRDKFKSINVHIGEICEKRGITTAYQLQKAVMDATLFSMSPSVASKLFNGTFSEISLATMARLCSTLDVTPGELFSYGKAPLVTKPSY